MKNFSLAELAEEILNSSKSNSQFTQDQSNNNRTIINLPTAEEINEQYQKDSEREEIINSPILKKPEEKVQVQEYLKKIVEAEILIKIKRFSAAVLQKLKEIATKPKIYQLLNKNKRVEQAVSALQGLEKSASSQPTNNKDNNQYLVPLLLGGGVIVLLISALLVVRSRRLIMPRDKEFEKILQAAEDPKNIGQGSWDLPVNPTPS
ncbi:4755_t:CDS:2, partial [Ambispora gerdemannii]